MTAEERLIMTERACLAAWQDLCNANNRELEMENPIICEKNAINKFLNSLAPHIIKAVENDKDIVNAVLMVFRQVEVSQNGKANMWIATTVAKDTLRLKDLMSRERDIIHG